MATTFSGGVWNTPESNLTAEEYCSVCLIDDNAKGQEKIKAKCKLPVRSKSGGPVNKNALRNAASRIFQLEGVSAASKRKAARSLVNLMQQAKIDVGETVRRLAGGR